MPLTGRLTAGDRRGRPACHGTRVKVQRSRLAIFSSGTLAEKSTSGFVET